MPFKVPSIVTMAVSLTIYEIFSVKVKRDLKNWVRGCSTSLKLALFDTPYTTFHWSAIVNIALSGTVFVTMAPSCLHHLRDKARYWSKIVIFSYPLHSAPLLGGPRQNIAIPFGVGELEWWAIQR